MSIAALRVLIPILFLVTLYLSQRYWVRAARRAIAGVQRPALRRLARGLWVGATLLLLASVVERSAAFFVRGAIPPMVSRWASEFLGLWFTWSIIGFLAISAVRGVDWLWLKVRGRVDSWNKGQPPLAADPGRRYFLRTATYAAGALPLAGALYGFACERFDFQGYRVEVPIPYLPPALEGLRITQLSDIHVSSYMPIAEVQRIVDQANDLHGDLIMVTGDLLTGRGDPLAACVAELARLRAPLGVWGCNGNHEIYADAEDQVELLFRQHGMTMLRQENAQLAWRGARFNLIGVDYQRQHFFTGERAPMLEGVEALVRPDMPNILLSHNPNAFPRASELGIELMLAGHTHGGQVQVEILDRRFTPARFITQYVAGLYCRPMRRGGLGNGLVASALSGARPYASVYVNRGLGTIGTPVRLGVPPEITLLTLRAAKV